MYSKIFIGTYLGYSIGTAPIIGYHYGARNTDELKSLLKKSLKLIGVTSIVMTLLAEVFSKLLASIFVSYDVELLELTTRAIRLFSLSFLRTLVFQIVMIFVLPVILKIDGLWLSVVVAEILALIVSAVFLILNRKKYQYA